MLEVAPGTAIWPEKLVRLVAMARHGGTLFGCLGDTMTTTPLVRNRSLGLAVLTAGAVAAIAIIGFVRRRPGLDSGETNARILLRLGG